jgi:hypothetical protein
LAVNSWSRCLILLIGFASLGAAQARAGWITIRNDTKQTLVVQDVTTVNGKVKAGKAIKLLPGESVRENRSKPGSKSIVVYDPARPNTPLLRGKVEWGQDDTVFSLTPEKTSITLAAIDPPKKP